MIHGRIILCCFGALAMGGLLLGCGGESEPTLHGNVVKRPGEPIIRVRIARRADRVRIAEPTKVYVYPADDSGNKTMLSTPVEITRLAGQWHGPWEHQAPTSDALVIEPVGPAPLVVGGAAYPGVVHLAAPDDLPSDRFDLVNHVPIESYLPGVLERELYDDWDPAAYLAQAIAARSYAIDQLIRFGPGRHYDVENTQASQAYAGLTHLGVARRAVEDTVGIVLTWEDRILCAYYSSTCGGAGQSATDAFNLPVAVPPLEARGPRQWCEHSKHFHWPTITRSRRNLARRLAAWGQARNLDIGSMADIDRIEIAETNPGGRPVRFRFVDTTDRSFTLSAEAFRLAANYAAAGLPSLERSERIGSSFFRIEVSGDKVYFTDGHGFGHGVGLCQFGTQRMAELGRTPVEILAEYYPGARLERAY